MAVGRVQQPKSGHVLQIKRGLLLLRWALAHPHIVQPNRPHVGCLCGGVLHSGHHSGDCRRAGGGWVAAGGRWWWAAALEVHSCGTRAQANLGNRRAVPLLLAQKQGAPFISTHLRQKRL